MVIARDMLKLALQGESVRGACGDAAEPARIAADDIVRTHAEAPATRASRCSSLEPLLAFLDAHGLGEGEPEIEPIGDGHSNVTYAVRARRRASSSCAARRAGRCRRAPTTCCARRACCARSPAGAPVPRVLAVCDDAGGDRRAVLRHGAARGRRRHERACPRRRSTGRASGGAWARSSIDALVDAPRRRLARRRARGLRPARRLPRAPAAPLRRAVGAQPHARDARDRAGRRAGWRDTCPASPPATIVHGDYRLGNVMFAPAPPARVVAMLDWEMSTIGDPLADLGYLCTFWVDRDDPPAGRVRAARVHARSRAGRRATSSSPATRSARAARSSDIALVPGARALEDHRLHGGQLPARARGLGRRPVPDARSARRSPGSRSAPRR